MNKRITPVGLKGYEITERMKQLMGVTSVNENKKTSVLELTKVGPDGNIYGIVRENHEYYIKVTFKKSNVLVEDFSYIGGLQNKKQESYPSYAKAIKHLNFKFNSLNEAYDKSGQINVFKNDNLEEGASMSECCGAPMEEGMCSECGYGSMKEVEKNPWAICTASVGREDKEKYEKCVRDIKKKEGIEENTLDDETLSEVEQSVEDMKEPELSDKQKKIAKLAGDKNKIDSDDLATLRKTKGKLSIETAIKEMDNIIENIVSVKKKVYTIK